MFHKRPIAPGRLRQAPPRGFGWIDHRLLREGYLARASTPALALYLLLACASDVQGLSYYSDARLCELLGLEASSLRSARRELITLDLIAFEKPMWQLLSLVERKAIDRGRSEHVEVATVEKTEVAFIPPPGFSLKAAVEEALRKADRK